MEDALADLTSEDRVAVMAQVDGEQDHQSVVGQAQLRDLAFDASPVAAIVVDRADNLALANAAARATFRIPGGDVGRPFKDLALSCEPVELRAPVEQARAERRQIEVEDVEWTVGGARRTFDVRVVPLTSDGGQVAVKVVFQDVSRLKEMNSELLRLKEATETAYEELQSTNAELETTNEELESTVEELETTNEELQSTNAELETTNAELQCTNVEIASVNEELRERTVQLAQLNVYTRAILNGLGLAVVVLDRELRVRTWNAPAEELWGLRPGEVDGAPFMDLEIGLPVAELRGNLNRCLRGEGDRQELRLAGHDRRGKPLVDAVTCMPLQGVGSAVEGVIVLVNGEPR